jgi:hypothetical protein
VDKQSTGYGTSTAAKALRKPGGTFLDAALSFYESFEGFGMELVFHRVPQAREQLGGCCSKKAPTEVRGAPSKNSSVEPNSMGIRAIVGEHVREGNETAERPVVPIDAKSLAFRVVVDFCDHFRSKRDRQHLTTFGCGLDPDRARALAEIGVINVSMLGKLLTNQLSPANPCFGTHRIQPARISMDQLKIMGTLKR